MGVYAGLIKYCTPKMISKEFVGTKYLWVMDIIKGFAHLNGFTIETYTLYRVSKKKHAFGEIHLQPCLVTHSLLISHEKTVASEEEVGGGGSCASTHEAKGSKRLA